MFLSAVYLATLPVPAFSQTQTAAAANQLILQRYCAGCHNDQSKTAGVSLQGVNLTRAGDHAEVLEKVLRKVKAGQMPPVGLPRPDAKASADFTKWLEGALDSAAAARPNPGRFLHPTV